MTTHALIGAIAVLVAGCVEPEPQPRSEPRPSLPSGGEYDTTEVGDPTEQDGPIDDALLFDPDRVIAVELTLDDADWTALRSQSRNLVDTLGGDCLSDPFGSPYTYFPAEVTVDGETLSDVGVRKKGFLGSLSFDKPSLKIKTDELVDGQRLANGTERLTLNNAIQDASYVDQCLGYDRFRAAGLPAPRCNFATVTVNGEPLGVYVHVEAVKKDFLRRHFTSPDGDLYEGTLSDFVEGWDQTFEAKTDETDPSGGPIADLSAALATTDVDGLLDALAPVLDLDAFYRFWAMEVLVGHGDGYASNANNYYLYRDPGTGLLTFVPWGTDSLFGYPYFGPVFLTSYLPQRLFETVDGRAAYVDAMEDLLDTVWDEAEVLGEIDRMEALLAGHLDAAPEWTAALDEARFYVEERRSDIEASLSELEGWQITAEPREPFCFSDLGPIDGAFETEWGTLEGDVFEYTASLSFPGMPADLFVGAGAGTDEHGTTIVSFVAVPADWTYLYQLAVFLPGVDAPGSYDLDEDGRVGWIFWLDLTDPYADGDLVGLVSGTVTLTEVGTVPGDPVVGVVEGSLLGGLF